MRGFCKTMLLVLLGAGISGLSRAQDTVRKTKPPLIRGADGGREAGTGIKRADEDESGEKKKPVGPKIGSAVGGSRLIEKFRLERVQVFPEDPESAWWEANPRDAFALAQRQQKPMILLFTADWNAKCMALSEEVFTTQAFNDYVKNQVIICYLNYPRSKTEAPDAMRHWKEKFKILGYPNLLVFDPEGNVVQELTGYNTGKPVTYFNRLKGMVSPVIAAVEERKNELRVKGFRDWENTDGHKIFARFVKRGGNLVTLQSADTNLWTIEIATLSESDRKFVKSFPSVEEVAAGPGPPASQR